MEAERRAGEMLKAMTKATPSGSNQYEQKEDVFLDGTRPQPLDRLGITRKQSMKWQALARMAEDDPVKFDAHVEDATTRVVANQTHGSGV